MYLIKGILVTTLLSWTLLAYSNEYYCPKMPNSIKLGEILEHDWIVWPDGQEITTASKEHYLKNSIEFQFEDWMALMSGESVQNKNKVIFIACCSWNQKTPKKICAYRILQEKYCTLNARKNPKMKFICGNDPFETPYSKIMKKLHG